MAQWSKGHFFWITYDLLLFFVLNLRSDMEFVQNFTPPDFQAKNFTPSISPNFNSFSKKKHKKWVKMEKFTPLAKILHCRRHWRHWQIPPLVVGWREIRLTTQVTCPPLMWRLLSKISTWNVSATEQTIFLVGFTRRIKNRCIAHNSHYRHYRR